MLASTAALALALSYCATAAGPSGTVLFDGAFDHGLTRWRATNGGPQCANYGTPSKPPRLRGTFNFARVKGVLAGRFELPAARPPTYPLEACELITRRALKLGTTGYYGYMFYVPQGWTTDASQFWGITTAQFHFQNIWAAPIVFELHHDHMTLALETGACRSYLTAAPGCTWRSNADNPNGRPGNLGARYAVPRPMRLGVWHEIVMRVHWAADRSGEIQVWHRVAGTAHWTPTVSLRGYPTIQWDIAKGCCYRTVYDKIGAYRGAGAGPVSVWLADYRIGTSFAAVAAMMP